MTARNHHYVPQFYFRNFSPGGPEGGDVRLINLARRKYIATTSIKGQCYRVGFHDYKPGLESALGKLEALAAPAIRGIISSGVPPEPRSQDHQALAAFTAIQRSRTHTAAVTSDKMADRMFKIAYEDEAKRRGIDVSNYEIKSPFPVALPLGVAAKCSPLAMRLGVHVFVNETSEEFITSDNPVVAHNQYCEGINNRGVLGWYSTGIQIFLPVSPRHVVLLYDTRVYAVGMKKHRRASQIVDVSEVRSFNAFQIVVASENLYFRDATMGSRLLAQIEQLASKRRIKRNITVQSEAVAKGDGTSELIHQYERIIPLKFQARSVRIKRGMRRISLDERARMPDTPEMPGDSWPRDETGVPMRYPAKRSFSA